MRLRWGIVLALLTITSLAVWFWAMPQSVVEPQKAALFGLPQGIRAASAPVIDWAKLENGASSYFISEPQTIGDVTDAVHRALEEKIAIRIRGRGHSTNASSLPRTGELLVATSGLNYFRVLDAGSVLVGAGESVYGIRKWLERYGYTLPVYNMGEVGPSVGGYISAGGVGEGAAEHGGFWENVLWIGLVDGLGQYRRIERTDPLFRWMFGSMGQLGIVVEAALRIIPARDKEQLPLPAEGRIPSWGEQEPEKFARYEPTFQSFRLYSQAVFVPQGSEKRVRAELIEFFEPYKAEFQMRRILALPVRFRTFNPPLVFPEQKSFTVVGLEYLPIIASNSQLAVRIDLNFADYVRGHHYRRYIQMEMTRDPKVIADYFGEHVWNEFRQVKQSLDPHGVFGRGLFPAPATSSR